MNQFLDNYNEDEQVDESLKSALTISGIAALLSIPGILPAKTLTKELQNVPIKQMRINAEPVKNARDNASVDKKKINGMSKTNIANAIAMVLWLEARGESEEGRKAVASVILNRADGKIDGYIPVLKEKYAFSCLNNYKNGWTDETYKFYSPSATDLSNKTNLKIWENCKEIGAELVVGKFKSTIGNRNSYLNPKTAGKTAKDGWGKKCDLKVGNHKFGYLPEHDGKRVVAGTMKIKPKPKTKEYVIAKGDTLWRIAKQNNVTIKEITDLNPNLKPEKLQIGQKIKIKV